MIKPAIPARAADFASQRVRLIVFDIEVASLTDATRLPDQVHPPDDEVTPWIAGVTPGVTRQLDRLG
jgi:hypothetical protein